MLFQKPKEELKTPLQKPKYQRRLEMFDVWYKSTREEIAKKFDELEKNNDTSDETKDFWVAKIIRLQFRNM